MDLVLNGISFQAEATAVSGVELQKRTSPDATPGIDAVLHPARCRLGGPGKPEHDGALSLVDLEGLVVRSACTDGGVVCGSVSCRMSMMMKELKQKV